MEQPREPAGAEEAASLLSGATAAALEGGEQPAGCAPDVARVQASAVRYARALRQAVSRDADRLLEVAGRRAEALCVAAAGEAARVKADAARTARTLLAQAAVDAEDLEGAAGDGVREICEGAQSAADDLVRLARGEAATSRLAAAAADLKIRAGAEAEAAAVLAEAADGLRSAQEALRLAQRSAADIGAAAAITAGQLAHGAEESLADARSRGIRAEREAADVLVVMLRRSAGELAAARHELDDGAPEAAEHEAAEHEAAELAVDWDEETPADPASGPLATMHHGLTADRVLVYCLLVLLSVGPAVSLLAWWLIHS